MNKLTFNVKGPKEGKISSLIKDVTKIRCRIYLDIENNQVNILDVCDEHVDSVIDLVNTYYEILGVDIDTICEEEIPPEESNNDEVIKEEPNTVEKGASDVATAIVPVEVEPQKPEDLIVKKVEFQNQMVEDALNQLARSAYWAIYKQNCFDKDVASHIWTATRELSKRFGSEEIIPFSFGDIVDCYFGTHLPREINGGHVFCLVINVGIDNLVYVTPITKQTTNISSNSFITFKAPEDVVYNDSNYTEGTLLLDMSKYIRAERFQKIVGRANPEFVKRVLLQLASTHDFIAAHPEIFDDVKNEDDDLPFTMSDEPIEKEVIVNEKVTPVNKEAKSVNCEAVLGELLKHALSNIKKGESFLGNLRTFLADIGMTADNPTVNEAFIAACEVKKITFETIAGALHNKNEALNEDEIKAVLKETFKEWMATKEELKDYPRLTFTALLKLFAKAMA